MSNVPTPTTDPHKPPMTQEECEAYILLKGQSGEPVFEIHLVDKEVDQDPTMRTLMNVVSQMIHQGIMGMPFQEAEAARTAKPGPTGIVGANGKPAE